MIAQGRLGTRDLPRAKVFYDAISEMLGAECVRNLPNAVFYRGKEGTMLIVGLPFAGEATVGNGTMLGIAAPSREMVDAIFAKAIELGGTSEGAPGPRGPEGSGYYACYFRDLDGNKLMVNHVQKP